MKKMRKIYFCPKCKSWRGNETKCPECGKSTIPTEVPIKRGSYYYIPGIPKPLPAVTSILEVLAKPALIIWAAKTAARAALANPWMSEKEATASIYKSKEKAGARGKDIHKVIENLIRGKITKQNGPIRKYIEAYKAFQKTTPHRVLASEKIVYSKKYGFAGTLDCIAKLKSGEIVILDFKTGKNVYWEASLQLSAYLQALTEMFPKSKVPEKTFVVHLKPNGTFSLVEMTAPLVIFLSCMKIWQWREFIEE